jgi:hypothetical protein
MNRPDHLTRAVGEMERWDDAVRLEDDAALAATRLRVIAADLPAPLGDDRGAEAAASAIRSAIRPGPSAAQ